MKDIARIGRNRQRARATILPRGYSEEESSTVIVGESAPSLEDVISGAVKEQPFDLASFMVFAERRLFLEAVVFLTEVDALRPEVNLHIFQRRLRHIMSEFVGEDAPRQVNLSDGVRQKTEAHATAVLNRLMKAPFAEPDRSCLDSAYASVLKLVRDDQYCKYMDYILVQRQLRFSRLEAQWWTNEDLTLSEFFTFPSPVDAVESRLHAFLTVLLVVAALALSMALHSPWLWLYLTYGFLMRSLCGPRLDPQAFLVLFVLRPLAEERLGPLKDEFLPSPPMRFAQFCGLIMSVGSAIAAFWGRYDVMLVFASILLFFSCLWSMFDTCIICSLYLLFVNAKLLPSSFCVDCSIRYVKGQGLPTRPRSRSMSASVLKKNRKSFLASATAAAAAGGGGARDSGRRRATPSFLRERFSSSSLWKPYEDKGGRGDGDEEEGKATPAEDTPSLTGSSTSNIGDRPKSRRLDSSGSVGGTSSTRTASDQSNIDTTNDTDNAKANDSNRKRSGMNSNSSSSSSRISIPRSRSLTARNFLGFSKDFTASIAPRSRKHKRSKMLADLEDYNKVFSVRHSRGRTAGGGGAAAAAAAGGGEGRNASPPPGSRTTSRTYSGRTVSDLDVEPAADVERRRSGHGYHEEDDEEDMSVDDDEDFDPERSGRAVSGGSSGDGDDDAPPPSLAPLFDDGVGGGGCGGGGVDRDAGGCTDDCPV